MNQQQGKHTKGPEIVPEQYIDRSMAAMAALGVGDAAGDLGRSDAVRQRYGILTWLLPEGRSTDDTEFTILSARALLDHWNDYSAKNVADCWRRLVVEQGGAKERGGMPLYGALWNLEQGVDPPLSGQDNVFNVDDGAAMRAVPFGIAALGNAQKAASLAAIDASVSHDRDGIWAAQAIAASIATALTGSTVDQVIQAGMDWAPEDSWLGRRIRLVMQITEGMTDTSGECSINNQSLSDIASFQKGWAALHEKLWTPKHSSAPEAIAQVYGLYRLSGGDFMKAFVLSANFGRDADTICALTLALCAAGQGLQVIPESWIEQVRNPSGVCLPFAVSEDLIELGRELAERALRDQHTSH